jgi:succinate dehydrogenase flavin-adding protein (antitoxin of CptAB toxin-antitoxin module)
MKIEKALELYFFQEILKIFDLDLFVWVFKRAPR